MEGPLPPEEYKWLAVVGSRRYSQYGREACEKLIAGLYGHPVVIVSGLALGIDCIAHRAALEAKLKCVAVPGSGISRKVLHPSANRPLAEKILEDGGALLSEFPPEFRATLYSFPQRNRVMAGLSDAVLVIEAEKKSGTLITARLASEYNRDVLTVPGSIFSGATEGPHLLMRLGATPVRNADELLVALGFKAISDSERKNRNYSDCSPEEIKILELLTVPMERDALIAAAKLPVSKTNAVLSLLEIKGFISEGMGEIHLI
ncbi:MAG: DNA processing protein [Parcubacteria group bacterium Gr01-1014_17]|nr:MAG: DNA processing protein [Parcubacteria group bacterium Gr01-1014_17]